MKRDSVLRSTDTRDRGFPPSLHSLLRTTFMGEGHPHANDGDPLTPTDSSIGGAMPSMPTGRRHNPACPECGTEAIKVSEVDDDNVHDLKATCANGHIWITRWFAVRSA